MPRFTAKTAPHEWLDLHTWVECDCGDWSLTERKRYADLKHCIALYVRGESVATALQDCGLSYEQLLRAFNRCLHTHSDGRRFGWRALAKHVNVAGYDRTWPVMAHEALARGGYAGALDALFKAYPPLEDALVEYILTRCLPGSIPNSTVRLETLHRYFIRLCKAQGLDCRVWPLCTTNLGREAIRGFMHQAIADNYDQVVQHQYGKVAAIRAQAGRGYAPHHVGWLPYDVVELDEHCAHFFGSVGFPSPKGWRYLPLSRLSLILAFDRCLEDVVGAAMTLCRMPSGRDILAAVHSCLTAPTPAPLDYDFLQPAMTILSESDPIPCQSSETEGCSATAQDGCGFNILAIDNALSHLAEKVISRVFAATGAVLCFGAMRRPTCRAIAELCIQRLCEAGFELLPSTTGSHPRDPLRNDPEANASHFRMKVGDMAALISGCIKDVRKNKGKANHGITAASQVQLLLDDADAPLLLPHLVKSEPANSLLLDRINKTVAGSESSGRRPYISYLGEDYTAPWLSGRWGLVGASVRVLIDTRNIQTLHVLDLDGAYLGRVHAPSRWAKPHSADARRMIQKLIALGKLCCVGNETYLEAWMRLCKTQALAATGQRRPRVTAAATAIGQELLLGNLDQLDLDAAPWTPWVDVPLAVPDDASASSVAGGLRAINR